MKKTLFVLTFFSICTFAQSPAESLFNQCINAHGGLKKWQSFQGLTYTLNNGKSQSTQTTHLRDRRSYHKAEKYELGFDGKKTWVKGDKESIPTKNPDFYYNLDFYFFAMPFVIADNGVKLKKGQDMSVLGKVFNVLEVSYEQNIGSAPNDIYKLLIDKNSHQMEWLLYSVTFFDKKNKQLSAKKYENWRLVNGLILPTKMDNYKFENDQVVGEPVSTRTFSDIVLTKKIKDLSIFNNTPSE